MKNSLLALSRMPINGLSHSQHHITCLHKPSHYYLWIIDYLNCLWSNIQLYHTTSIVSQSNFFHNCYNHDFSLLVQLCSNTNMNNAFSLKKKNITHYIYKWSHTKLIRSSNYPPLSTIVVDSVNCSGKSGIMLQSELMGWVFSNIPVRPINRSKSSSQVLAK